MAKIFCKKCDLQGNSKNIHCRTIFPNWPGPLAMIYDHMCGITKFEESEDGDGIKHLVFEIKNISWSRDGKESPEEFLRKLFTDIVNHENAKQIMCNHHWDYCENEVPSV